MRKEEALQAMIASPNPRVQIFEKPLENALQLTLFPVWRYFFLLQANALLGEGEIVYATMVASVDSTDNSYTEYCIAHELNINSATLPPITNLVSELRKNQHIPTVLDFEDLGSFSFEVHQWDLILDLFHNQCSTELGFPVVETPILVAVEYSKHDTELLCQVRKYGRVPKSDTEYWLTKWFETEKRSSPIFENPVIGQYIIPAIVQMQLDYQDKVT